MLALFSLFLAAGSFIAIFGMLREGPEDQIKYNPYQKYAKKKYHPSTSFY
jgi:hypothetical protein